jgi:amino acid transporter
MEARSATMATERLERNALGLPEIVMTGLAQMAPAFSVMFTAALIASVAGASVPLVFLLAMVAIAATGNALAQFSRIWPSSGSFITFISRAIGPRVGLSVSVTALVGYIVAFAGVYLFVGSYIAGEMIKSDARGLPQLMTILFGIFVTVPVILGVRVGIRAAIIVYAFEVAILLAFIIAVLVQGGDHGLSATPFTFSGAGLKGVALGFALAVLAFVGFEAPAPLAEESENPRRNVPLAIMIGIFLTGTLYVAGAYAGVMAFPDAAAFAGDGAPFTTAAKEFISPIGVLVTWLLLTSVTGSYLGANTETARVIFSGAREGLWSRHLARVHPRFKTPWLAVIAFVAPSVALGVLATAFTDLGTASGFLATYGTLGIIFMYVMTNFALTVLWVRERRAGRTRPVLTWLVVPIVGISAMALPYWSTFQPGQPSPYDKLPWLFPLLIALGILYTVFLQMTKPHLVQRAGTIVMGDYLPAGELLENARRPPTESAATPGGVA